MEKERKLKILAGWTKILELIHAYGSDKVLWATDFPMWESTSEMEMFNKIDLTEEERNLILYENAAKLLGLK